MKKCSTCKEPKELSEFTKNRSTKDGLSYQCKPCRAESKKKWQDKNKDSINEYRREYSKTEDGKRKIKVSRDKWLSSDKGKIYLDSDIHKDRVQKWRRESGEMALKGSIERAIEKRAYNKDVLFSGERVKIRELYKESRDKGFDWHVDHIIPYYGVLEDGRCVMGAHRLKNLQILHKDDNLEKGNFISYETLKDFEEGVHFIFIPEDYNLDPTKYPKIGFDVIKTT